jgi:dephospho-CoA kinase
MKKIGLTGGIGSGKSTVAKVLQAMRYPVFYSDDSAKNLVEDHPQIREELINLLGTNVYEGGSLNKLFLAQQIFSDDSIREQVNAIIHPKVREAFQLWSQEQHSELVFNEAAILFESGLYKQLDATILVVAPKNLKIQRVMKRDQLTEQAVLDRMSKQWDDSEKIPLADFVIVNDEKQPLLIQIEKIVNQLLMKEA